MKCAEVRMSFGLVKNVFEDKCVQYKFCFVHHRAWSTVWVVVLWGVHEWVGL